MRMRKPLIAAILLIALLAFTASLALADDSLPPTEEPTEPDDSTEQTGRLPGQNPVAWFLSQYFTEDENIVWDLEPPEGELDPQGETDPQNDNDMYDYIMGLHEDYGFGVLARAFYVYSQISNPDFLGEGEVLPEYLADLGSFEDFLAARQGVGWGALYKELEMDENPSVGSLGWAFKHAEEAEKPGKSSKWAKNPTEPDEAGEPDESGEAEVTGAGVKPDKPGKPDKPDKPNKPDQAGKKDKKPKDK